jgi:hypothetical protein
MGSYSFYIDLQLDLPLDPLVVMLDMHERFQRSGLGESDEYEFILTVYEYEHDFEPKPVVDINSDFKELAQWPALGGVIYGVYHGYLAIDYSKEMGSQLLQRLSISFWDRWLDPEIEHLYRDRLIQLVIDTHMHFQAVRTVWQWEIETMYGYSWEEERQRLAKSQVKGLYWLDILRKDFVTPERIDFLSRHLKEESLLKRLDDGSLFYQQTPYANRWFEGCGVKAE